LNIRELSFNFFTNSITAVRTSDDLWYPLHGPRIPPVKM